MSTLRRYVVVAWLLLLSVYTGGLVFILVVLVPTWRMLTASEFLGWAEALGARVGMLMAPTLILSLIAGVLFLILAWRHAPRWIRALVITAVLLLITQVVLLLGYFLPADLAFAAHEVAVADVPDELDTWASLHVLRTVLAGIAWLSVATVAIAGDRRPIQSEHRPG